MSAGRVVSLVVGSLVVLVAIALLLGGGAILVVERAFGDDEGFLAVDSIALHRDAFAITAPATIDGESYWWWWDHPTTLRVEAKAVAAHGGVFIGVASRSDVETYLKDVAYAEIGGFRFADMSEEAVEYRDRIGVSVPAAPASQRFWKSSATGGGLQTLLWNFEVGDWVLVAMNADGSGLVDITCSVGVKAPWFHGTGVGLLVAGLVLLAVGLALVLFVARQTRAVPSPEQPAASGASAASSSFPFTFQAEKDAALSPALWLVKWFLLIPHYVVLGFLFAGFAVSWLISLVAILFTGRYPRGLFDYNVGVLRWAWRVGYYGYQALATDHYPPFTLRAGGYPADLDVVYPERLSPGLVLVKWWLLAIPHYVVIAFLQCGAGSWRVGLAPILSVFAGVMLLFTGTYPEDLRRLIVGMDRWTYRVFAYAALLTDAYPPFRLDE